MSNATNTNGDDAAELSIAKVSDYGYDPPSAVSLGNILDLTRGSASSGNADANSQYYW